MRNTGIFAESAKIYAGRKILSKSTLHPYVYRTSLGLFKSEQKRTACNLRSHALYFAKIVKNHDLYIVENDGEKQFIEHIETAVNRHIDVDTGEILTEEEMREFDGDIEEPDDLFLGETAVPDVVQKLKKLLGDVFIVR